MKTGLGLLKVSSTFFISFPVYLKEGHKNEIIYKTRDAEATSKLEWLLSHSLLLQQLCLQLNNEILQTEAYEHLIRLISEQTEQDTTEKIVPKSGKDLHSEILQNPSDPDATYRQKYTGHVGYVANVVASFKAERGTIKHYDLKPNTYSDTQFSQDIIEILKNPEGTTVLVNGAYYSDEINQKSKGKGIEFKPGQLVGKFLSKSYNNSKLQGSLIRKSYVLGANPIKY